MNQTPIFLILKINVHSLDVIACIGLIPQRPKQNRRMIFKRFKTGSCTIQNNLFPLRNGTGHVTGRFSSAKLLKTSMAFQIALCHDINSGFIAKKIPGDLIRIMAGTYGIDIVFQNTCYIGMHLLHSDASSGLWAPFMTVNPCDDETLSVQINDLIHDFYSSKANIIRYKLQ